MASGRVTKRSVEAVRAIDRDAYLWDTDLPGFGVKATPAGAKVYLVQYRPGGRGAATKRYTLGRHGPLTAEAARVAAKRILGQVANGKDPAADKSARRKAGTIAQLADRYLAEHVAVHNKPSTQVSATRIVKAQIKPGLGTKQVALLTRAEVVNWHHKLHATPYEANRSLAHLSKMLSLASRDWGLRLDNPCIGIKRFPERKRERFYSDDELKRIGAAVADAQAANSELPGALAAIKLLAVTGCRLGEILALKWEHVDIEKSALRLPDAKAGARTVPLGAAAKAILEGIGRGGPYVVHGPDPGAPLSVSTLEKAWLRLRLAAKVPDGRLHDFRHTAGTYAAQGGANAFLVRDLLGHKTLAMTGRYVERSTDPLRATADAVASRVAAAMEAGAQSSADIVPIRHGAA